jgi:hypothetical protein
MTRPRLHIVFSMSAGANLRKALKQIGRDDRVIALPDDLSFGPINPSDANSRAQWMEAELGYTGWEEIIGGAQAFWTAAVSARNRRVVWMSRRSAPEYAGFLEFVWRLDNSLCEIIDLTEVTVIGTRKVGEAPSRRLALGLGLLPAYQILENNLLDRGQSLTEEMRDACLAIWKRLRGENAALRILDDNLALRSAPLSFFDEQLLSCASHRWMKAARIVGDVLAKFWDDARHQAEDLVLAARLRALVEGGVLKGQGDLSQIRFSEVRLPTERH